MTENAGFKNVSDLMGDMFFKSMHKFTELIKEKIERGEKLTDAENAGMAMLMPIIMTLMVEKGADEKIQAMKQ